MTMILPCFPLAYIFFYLTTICYAQATTCNSTSDPQNAGSLLSNLGWTAGPDGRGTIDMIYSCSFTMFLCSLSVLCLNVPGLDDSQFRQFRRRVYITALAFLGPEFIFQIALGQFLCARDSVRQFRASGVKGWTMTHAFYADMGGFILRRKGSTEYPNGWPKFPVNAKQVRYLWSEGYIEFPSITREEIHDKN